MAFVTEQAGPIASVAAPLLARSLVLPATVLNIPGGELSGPTGGTLNVRVPHPGSANSQAAGGGALTPATIDEDAVAVTVTHEYHLTVLDEYQLNLDIESFAEQVTAIQVQAVAEAAENKIATVMNGLAADINFANTPSESDTIATILAAREALGEQNVPVSGRFLAVSPQVATRLLSTDLFVKANESGSAEALREAVLGRIFGFTVVESNALSDDTAVAYHRSGFVFISRAPMNLPPGSANSAQATHQGIGVRQVFQYDSSTATQQSLVSTFAGAAAVYDDADDSTPADSYRWVKIGTESSSSSS